MGDDPLLRGLDEPDEALCTEHSGWQRPERAADADGDARLEALARPLVPIEPETRRADEALAALDAHGGTRLVVVGEGDRYVGIVCLRGDRRRLCVDAARLRVLA